jgi:hypothetical protein
MKPKQTTCHLMMIRPVHFQFNEETAVNNAFQQANQDNEVQQKALLEFDAFVEVLNEAGIDVTVIEDTPAPVTPDSIFPNNWISFHNGDTIVLYPMYAENRRAERKPHVIEALKKKFQINATLDFSGNEKINRFLEGTGSMVLDRQNNIAYACLSQRTDLNLFKEWCTKMNFTACAFHSVDEHGSDIYHTNVMMCVADKYVVICLDSIRDETEKQEVIAKIKSTGKEIIEIDYEQMNHFAGNMLQVENKEGKKFLVMSSQAYHSLNENQIARIESFNPILHSPLYTIEKNGGGSARCMMAEVFLSIKSV